MTDDVIIERRFPVPVRRVFEYMTRPENVLTWWGHDGMVLSDCTLDFTRRGPWQSVMTSGEGKRFKMSGQVIEVDPPRRVTLTWGWHDDRDSRGAESRVTFELTPLDDDGTRLVLVHSGLPDDDYRASHKRGWTSVLSRFHPR